MSGLSRDPYMSTLAYCQALCNAKNKHQLKCADLRAFRAAGDAGPAVQELATEVKQLQKKIECLQWELKSKVKLLSGVYIGQVIGTTVL